MDTSVIVITGASSGIGRAAALLLAEQGHTVYAAARRMDKMEDLKEHGIIPISLDISKEDDVRNVVNTVLSKENRIDVLVNNAGFGIYGPVEDIPIADARYQFDVNVFGLAFLTQLVLPSMRKQGKGRIVNVSSVVGRSYAPLSAWYCASKHALEGWSDALRFELQPFNIDVVVVQPGLVKTGFSEVAQESFTKYAENSAYTSLFESYAARRNSQQGSNAQLLGQVIVEAVTAKRPKTRYVKGMFSKPILFIRKYFSDRTYDALMRRILG